MVAMVVKAWIYVLVLFVAVMHCKRVAKDQPLTLFWKVHLYPLAVVGWLLDAVFNVLFGTLMFVEFPHELLFSDRVQRHYSIGRGWRKALADFWARQLNQMDPGHIRNTQRFRDR